MSAYRAGSQRASDSGPSQRDDSATGKSRSRDCRTECDLPGRTCVTTLSSLPRIDAALDQVRSFYAALDAGDIAAASACLAPDATDNRGEEGPIAGAEEIVARRLDADAYPEAAWTLDALLADGERVAVQCTLTWREPESGDLESQSDSEWLTVREGRIAEIRSYRGADEDDDGPVLTEDDFDWSMLETGDDPP